MWKKVSERIFPFIIALSALSVSASAAFYSVSGLSKLFAGVSLAVIIMGGSLEVAKLIIASLLYQYRKTLPKLLKIYLTIAVVVLMVITSMGIYGFLSSGYQQVANSFQTSESQISLLESQKSNLEEQLNLYKQEKTSSDESIKNLRAGLSNNVIQYRDRTTGQIMTTTSSATRGALEKQLNQAIDRQTYLNTKIDTLNSQRFRLETEISNVETSVLSTNELGPLKYLSDLTGAPMGEIVNILLLIIIFVFDPLAIALVIVANFAFDRLRTRYKENIYGESIPIIEKKTPEYFSPPKEEHIPEINEPQVLTPQEEELLKNPNISGWRKNKILKKLVSNLKP